MGDVANTILTVFMVLYAITGPFILYQSLKVSQEKAEKSFMDEDSETGCFVGILFMLYGLDIISLLNMAFGK